MTIKTMEEIKIGFEDIDYKQLMMVEKTIWDACMLKVKAGTTGYRGGDSGLGSRTVLEFENDGGDMVVEVKGNDDQTEKVTFRLGGDAELRNLIAGLKFAAEVLEEQSKSGQLTIKAE